MPEDSVNLCRLSVTQPSPEDERRNEGGEANSPPSAIKYFKIISLLLLEQHKKKYDNWAAAAVTHLY